MTCYVIAQVGVKLLIFLTQILIFFPPIYPSMNRIRKKVHWQDILFLFFTMNIILIGFWVGYLYSTKHACMEEY